MTLANTYGRPARLHAVSKPDYGVPPTERDSDVWPDWSTELDAAEIAKSTQKNKPATILREAAGAIAYSVGLVVLLMIVLGVLHIR
jgi:hypothetical protein